jgi:hypothetical protein
LLAKRDRGWLFKRPLAFGGRGQLRAARPLEAREWSWVEASLRSDGLIVEPLVRPTLELSLHGCVWRDGRVELGRICVQDVSEYGVFRGVRLAALGELEKTEELALETRMQSVAQALLRAGYFGPFGIDAYRYEHDGKRAFCALSEINARYTMSFVVGFPRHPSELWFA